MKSLLKSMLKSPWGQQFIFAGGFTITQTAAWSWQLEAETIPPETQRLMTGQQPVLYAIWHGRMFLLMRASLPKSRMAPLISPSSDGELITKVAKTIGFARVMRGSSRQGGTKALLAMRRALAEEALSLLFTVDGPKGPRYCVKPGIVALSLSEQIPIIPVTASASRLLCSFHGAWDHFYAPFYGSRIRIAYGEPLWPPTDASGGNPDALQAHSHRLQTQLRQLTEAVDQHYGRFPLLPEPPASP
ncbi:MAG: DUF374 domain-containing protein [Candidatus Melainabacteria bacterium]|nr:DUF374 domain-containing protein [Candidatus Melainabacteria bacterium]